MWHTKWRRLSNEIAGLLAAGTYAFTSGENDTFGVTDQLLKHVRRIIDRLQAFEAHHGTALPAPATTRLREFLQYFGATFGRATGFPGTMGTLTALTAFRAEFEYLLADTEALARSLVDRAFVHLQRSLVVDPILRQRWQEAISEGELACERLGAVHLLWHGVWAFKVSGTGERTDLVMGTPLTDISGVQRAAEVLALTEWKIVRDPKDMDAAITQARTQSQRYAVGVLGGIELASRRYLVLVSKGVLVLPAVQEERGLVYEPVNVAIDPAPPSKVQRRE